MMGEKPNIFKKIPINNFIIRDGTKIEIDYEHLLKCLNTTGGIYNFYFGPSVINQTISIPTPEKSQYPNSVLEYVSEYSPRDKLVRAYHKKYMDECSKKGIDATREKEFNSLIKKMGWTNTKDRQGTKWSKKIN